MQQQRTILLAEPDTRLRGPRTDERGPRAPWPEPSVPFLSQPRAHTALRHQLDLIIAALTPPPVPRGATQPEGAVELLALPHRVLARVESVAVTFSWLSGRLPTIADGCLLVIGWRDLSAGVRGVAALRSATPTQERTYVAEGTSAEEWRWRSDDPGILPCSSTHLVAEWMARTGMTGA